MEEIIVLVGKSSSGKDTIQKKLIEEYDVKTTRDVQEML